MKLAVIIVCRSGDEPLTPGSHAGYQCAFCDKRLQLTASGLAMKAKYPDAKFCCNPCGMMYADMAKQLGILEGIQPGPEAVKQLQDDKLKNNPIAQWLARQIEEQKK